MRLSEVLGQPWRWWLPFRQALLEGDREAFARLFACVKRLTWADVHFPRGGSRAAVMLVVLLEHQRQSVRLKRWEGG
jgi:hypothetical protein